MLVNLLELPDFIDKQFVRTKLELDKKAIADFVELGGTVEGFKLDDKTVLTIR